MPGTQLGSVGFIGFMLMTVHVSLASLLDEPFRLDGLRALSCTPHHWGLRARCAGRTVAEVLEEKHVFPT